MVRESEQNAEVRLGKLTRREFRERMNSGELLACIIPIGATEQHLEHLAMEHDAASCQLIAEEVAKRLRPRVLVAPFGPLGISEHHMRHPGTISLMPGTFLSILHDVIRCLVQAGFENILVLNGHGGNIAPCGGSFGQLQQRFEVNLQFESYWSFFSESDSKELLVTQNAPGHAQEFETAIALSAFPENVRQSVVADQQDQEAVHATAEAGSVALERIISKVVDRVAEMLSGKCQASIPPFFE